MILDDSVALRTAKQGRVPANSHPSLIRALRIFNVL